MALITFGRMRSRTFGSAFAWSAEDFDAGDGSVQRDLARHVDDEAAARALSSDDMWVAWLDYDWRLNGTVRHPDPTRLRSAAMPKRAQAAWMLPLVLLACAAPRWDRPCARAGEYEAARKACIAESGDDTGTMHYTTSRFVEKCLREQGWQKMEKGESLACDQPQRGQPASGSEPAALPFDACFESCRELTDRSKGECFDTCLGKVAPPESGSSQSPE